MACPRCKTESGFSEKMLVCARCGYPNASFEPDEPAEPDVPVLSDDRALEEEYARSVGEPFTREREVQLIEGEPCPTCGKKVGRRTARREEA